MAEITVAPEVKKEPDTQAATTAPSVTPSPQSDFSHTKVAGRFNQYTSGYWALALPLLSVRYIAEGMNNMLRPILKNPKFPKNADTYWAPAVGATMIAATGYYTERTYEDMKRQFKEPLGWEFDKSPEKIGLADMMRSQNTLVKDAVKNLAKRTVMRVAVHLPFFTYLLPKIPQQSWEAPEKFAQRIKQTRGLVQPKDAVNLGVGSNAAYLASDALGRKRTFFEELQTLIDNKINQKDRIGETITAGDLMNLYELQARGSKKVANLPKMNTPEWDINEKLFQRMADLMNQTYGNAHKKEYADFTVPKLVYMLGMGALKSENLEKNLDYVEVANRHGIPAIKKISEQIKKGVRPTAAFAAYPVTDGIHTETIEAEKDVKQFAQESLRQSRPQQSFTSFAEKAAQKSDSPVYTVG